MTVTDREGRASGHSAGLIRARDNRCALTDDAVGDRGILYAHAAASAGNKRARAAAECGWSAVRGVRLTYVCPRPVDWPASGTASVVKTATMPLARKLRGARPRSLLRLSADCTSVRLHPLVSLRTHLLVEKMQARPDASCWEVSFSVGSMEARELKDLLRGD